MTPASLLHPSGPLYDALEPWSAVGATGALRLLDPPGGSVYLTDGQISFAECPPACGLDRLLTASGRLTAEAWRSALTAGRGNRRVGETLVHRGLLSPSELESFVLSALYGAAHFLFDLDASVRFEIAAAHVVGPVVSLDLRTVCMELDRRRRVLADTWPDAKLDSHAVLPARRLPGHHVTLTTLQWEIVANADRRRTPVELARSLGRDTFVTLLEVRRLARAGLVEPGRPGTATLSGTAVSRLRDLPADGHTDTDTRPKPPNGSRPWTGEDAGERETGGTGVAASDGRDVIVPLPRRPARAESWFDGVPAPRDGHASDATGDVTGGSAFGPSGGEEESCPDSTLLRIRDALVAMR